MIKELPYSTKQEFKHWCIFTGIFSGLILFSLIIATGLQIQSFIRIKNKNNAAQEQLKKHGSTLQLLEQLQEQQKKLAARKIKLERFKEKQNYFDLLLTIAEVMPTDIMLNQFSGQKKEIDFSGIALNQQAIGQFLTKIKTLTNIKNVTLISLQQTNQEQFSFSIKAYLI